MKQIYMSVLLVMLFTVNVFGEQHASKFGEKEKVAVVYENNVFLKAEPRNSVDDAFRLFLLPQSQVRWIR